MLYNDAFAVISGERHTKAKGAPHNEVWFDIRDVVSPLVQMVFDGESIHMDHMEFLIYRHGHPEEAHFSFSCSPLSDTSGVVHGIFCACAETTMQVVLQRDLDRERTMLAQIFEEAPCFIARVEGPELRFEMANPAYLRLAGRDDIAGKTALQAFPGIELQIHVEMLNTVCQTGRPCGMDGARVALQRRPDGPAEERLFDFTFQPIRDRQGMVRGILIQDMDSGYGCH